MSSIIRPAGLAHAAMLASLRESLSSGDLKPGDRIPSENELARQYGISITSVRRGIESLVREGVLRRVQGSGTYVQSGTSNTPQIPATTIAIAMNLVVRQYHPFFSELRRGLLDGVAEAGWSVWEYPFTARGAGPGDLELVAATDAVADSLLARGDAAGAVLGAHMMETFGPRLGRRFPVVAPDMTEACPFATYDWEFEMERLLRHLLRRGCRNIRLLRSVPVDVAGRAQAAEGVRARIEAIALPHAQLMSEVVRQAFDATEAVIAADPSVDGLALGGDFEAQGAVDALQRLGRSWPDDIRLVALVNRESVIHTPHPFTTLVADGFANGKALARLLDDHIRRPERAMQRCILSSEWHEMESR